MIKMTLTDDSLNFLIPGYVAWQVERCQAALFSIRTTSSPSGRHWGLKFAIDVIVLSQQGCLMLSLTINVYDWGELQLTTCFFATQAWSFVVNDFLERSSLLETIKVPPLVNDPCRRFWKMLPLFVQFNLSESFKHFSNSIQVLHWS